MRRTGFDGDPGWALVGSPGRAASVALGFAWLAGVTAWIGGVAGAAPVSLALGACFLAVAAAAPFRPRWQVHGPCVARVRTARPHLALTFDDGPDPGHTPRVLESLARHGAKATFFVIGEKARRHPELLRRMVEEGHQVENHSWHHSRLAPIASPRALARELALTSTLLARVTGTYPRWFRPPFGIVSPPVAAATREAGLTLCGWTATARDGRAGQTPERALRRLEMGLRAGAILTLHDAAERSDRSPIAPALLDDLLAEMGRRGLSSVTLDVLVAQARRAFDKRPYGEFPGGS